MSLLLLFAPAGIQAMSVETLPASSIADKTAALNGEILGLVVLPITRRGFQYNTVPFPDRETYEDGSFGGGIFSLNVSGLTPGHIYYYRVFVVDSSGTTYGDWVSFTALPDAYSVTISGVERSVDIIHQSIVIEDVINDKQNTLSFSLMDRQSLGVPDPDDEVVITLSDGTIIFSGFIIGVKPGSKQKTGLVLFDISCIDQVRLFDRFLVHKTYEGMTDKAIIQDIVATYCAGSGITTDNVIEGVTIDQIAFNYLQPSECMRKICDLTGRNWFIDYEKDVHYFPLATNLAPFNITVSNNEYTDFTLSKDASQLKNRVYVRGGTKLSDTTTYEEKGDGKKKQFVLPDKPHDITVAVNGVSKTVGIKNIDTSGFDYYVNFQEKYVEQDAGAAVLGTGDTLTVTYKYDIPILVAIEHTASISASGVHEFAIFDKTITTTQAARDRASAELTDYAYSIIEGSFKTMTTGFVSGQYMNIVLSEYGVNDDYIVQKVVARAIGGGNYEYKVYVASAKVMGIIRFFIELLEQNKNIIELNDNEVVDELVLLTDSLLNDSIHDNLVIDSAGPYATWCTDSLESTPTRAVWDLFQWG